jgi:hypothetical protein
MNSWKSTGSLLWIHGLRSYIPFILFAIAESLLWLAGSGKSVLWYVPQQVLHFLIGALTLPISSTVIQDIRDVCQTGLAILAFFYFDSVMLPSRMSAACCLPFLSNFPIDPIIFVQSSLNSIQPTRADPNNPARTPL